MLVLELSGSIKNTISIYYIKYNFNAEMMIPVVTSVTLVASILGGLISPMDGINPEDILINNLVNRVKNENIEEIS